MPNRLLQTGRFYFGFRVEINGGKSGTPDPGSGIYYGAGAGEDPAGEFFFRDRASARLIWALVKSG